MEGWRVGGSGDGKVAEAGWKRGRSEPWEFAIGGIVVCVSVHPLAALSPSHRAVSPAVRAAESAWDVVVLLSITITITITSTLPTSVPSNLPTQTLSSLLTSLILTLLILFSSIPPIWTYTRSFLKHTHRKIRCTSISEALAATMMMNGIEQDPEIAGTELTPLERLVLPTHNQTSTLALSHESVPSPIPMQKAPSRSRRV